MPLDQANLSTETPDEIRMSFGEHLEELRKRLFYAVLGSLGGIILCTVYAQEIIAFLVHPYRLALRYGGYNDTLVYPHPATVILTEMSIGFKAGLVICSPWIIYQVWQFVAAGLYPKERRLVYKYIGPSIFLFLSGIAVFFFFVLPVTLKFLIGFTANTEVAPLRPSWLDTAVFGPMTPGVDLSKVPDGDAVKFPEIPVVKSDPMFGARAGTTLPGENAGGAATRPGDAGPAAIWFNAGEGRLKMRVAGKTLVLQTNHENALFTPLPTIEDYLGFITFMGLLFGFAFEMPMVVMILVQIDLVRVATFRKMRMYAYFIFLVLAVIAAPTPDYITIGALWLMVVGLYELGVLLAALVSRKRDVEERDLGGEEA